VPTIQQPFLLASTSLDVAQTPSPPVSAITHWPVGKVFIAVDAALVSAAANAALPSVMEAHAFSLPEFSGNYNIHLGPVTNVQIKPDASVVSLPLIQYDKQYTIHIHYTGSNDSRHCNL
jgi:hypothetical protein